MLTELIPITGTGAASWELARFGITIKFSFLSGEVPHFIVKTIPRARQVCSSHYSRHTHTMSTLVPSAPPKLC